MNLLVKLAEETIEKLMPHISLDGTINTIKKALEALVTETDETLMSLFLTATSEELEHIKSAIFTIVNSFMKSNVEVDVKQADNDSSRVTHVS